MSEKEILKTEIAYLSTPVEDLLQGHEIYFKGIKNFNNTFSALYQMNIPTLIIIADFNVLLMEILCN